jgi:hypothetical protein
MNSKTSRDGPVILQDSPQSRTSLLVAIADTINTRGIPTARGKTWTAMQVSNVLARAGV